MRSLLIILFTFFGYSCIAQNWSEVAQFLPDIDVTPEDEFGHSIDAYGNIVVVGAPGNDKFEKEAGIAYVFEIGTDGGWTKVAELSYSDPEEEDRFGSAVAIYDETIVVSAPDKAVYLYEKPVGGWHNNVESAKLLESDKTGYTNFGKSIAIHGDTIVVGSPVAEGNIPSSGAAYVFVKPANGWLDQNTETAKLFEANPTTLNTTGRFGVAVDIFNNVVAVGSPRFDSTYWDQGAVFVFEKSGSEWTTMTETAKMVDSNPSSGLGRHVSIFGDTIMAAKLRNESHQEGSGHIFVKSATGWKDTVNVATLSISVDFGDYLFADIRTELYENFAAISVPRIGPVGSGPYQPFTGATFLFQKEGGDWVDQFETAMLISSDSTFDYELGSGFIYMDSIIAVGSPKDNSANSSGSVYLYEKPVDGWTGHILESERITQTFLSASNDRFGTAVAISGNYAVVGAPYDDEIAFDGGSVYVYEKVENAWEKVAKLIGSDIKMDDHFGDEVAIYGNTIAVGSPDHDDEFKDQGGVYIFFRPESGWSDSYESIKIISENNEEDANFGHAIDLHKDYLVVSSHLFRHPNIPGQVDLFRISNQELINKLAEFHPLIGFEALQFGETVDLFEDQLIIGSGNARIEAGPTQTKSFVFKRPETGWADTTGGTILERMTSDRSKCLKCGFDRIAVQINDSIALNSFPRLGNQDFSESVSGRILKFTPDDASWLSATHNLVALSSDSTFEETFSSSMSLSGNYLVSGNYQDSENNIRTGKTFVFENIENHVTGVVTEDQILLPENPSENADFGFDVSMYGDFIAVGAPNEDNQNGSGAGSIYLFESDHAIIAGVTTPQNGTYSTRDTILIDVHFSKDIDVSGLPEIHLELNDSSLTSAIFTEKVGPKVIRMKYVVKDGDVSERLDYRNENAFLYGGLILDKNNLKVNRVLPPIGTVESLAGSSSIMIDANKPVPFFHAPDIVQETFEVLVEFSRTIDAIDPGDLVMINASIQSSIVSNDSLFVEILPASEGDMIMYYPESSFFDLNATPNDSTGFSVFYDDPPPKITFLADIDDFTNGPFNLRVFFSEQVDEITSDDIGFVNASLMNFNLVNDTATIDIIPINDGQVIVYYSTNTVFDQIGQGNDSASFSTTFDNAPPTIQFSPTAENINQAFILNVDFSETIDEFDENDIFLNNATISDFTVDNGTVSFAVLPIEDGVVTIYYESGSVFDLAGNANDSTGFTTLYDETSPVIQLTSDVGDLTSQSFNMNVDFSETIDEFDENDISLNNATISDFTEDNGTVSFAVLPIEDGVVTIYYESGSVLDLAGNWNDSTGFTTLYDETSPVIQLTSDAGDLTNKSFKMDVDFSEAIDEFDENDISLNNATISDFTVDNVTVSFTVLPIEDGVVTIYYESGSVFDLAGNANDSTGFTTLYDETSPVIQLTSDVSEFVNDNYTVEVTFSEVMVESEVENFTVINADVSESISSDKSLQIIIKPLEEGEVIVSYEEGSISDLAGNFAEPVSLKKVYDITAPTVEVNFRAGNMTDVFFEIALVFSEAITDFENSNITLENLSIIEFNKEFDSLYHIAFERLDVGKVSITVDAFSFSDLAGNANEEVLEITEIILNDIDFVEEITISPNPVLDYLKISFLKTMELHTEVSLYNLNGAVHHKALITKNKNAIDLSNFASGVYILQIKSGTKIYLQKIIIE